MRLTIAVLLSLAAFAAEVPPAPTPTPASKPLTKEQARIAQLEQALAMKERELALESVRAAAARLAIPQNEFQKTLNKACEVYGYTAPGSCRFNGDIIERIAQPAVAAKVEAPKPESTTTAAAKPAPAAKGK